MHLASTKRTISTKCASRRGQTPENLVARVCDTVLGVWPRRNVHFQENVRFVEAKRLKILGPNLVTLFWAFGLGETHVFKKRAFRRGQTPEN